LEVVVDKAIKRAYTCDSDTSHLLGEVKAQMPSSDLIDLLVKFSKPAKLLVKLAAARPFLHSAELAIADYILTYPHEASRCTAQQLAERTGTSEASLFRFCRTFGIAGVTALRNELEQASAVLESVALAPVVETDDWNDSVRAAISAILGTSLVLEADVLSQAARAVAGSRSVNVCGMGPVSARLAEMLSFSLQGTGIPSFAWIDSRVSNLPEDFVHADDAAIGISHSGTNEKVAELLTQARSNGAVTIALTNYPSSIVGNSAEYVLRTGIWEDSFQMLEFLPRIAELLILSCFVQQVKKHKSADSDLSSSEQADE